uniref:Reverse transcriptase Ty1/copia-type domain-containing protein n=1 Tax=Fagus sylvatica TaxID=28930 RepID=A0A2N9HUB9_FAGSY
MESHGSNNQSDKKQWRAEEAIAGNAEALQALRDLITFPLYYSTQAHILGLKGDNYKIWKERILLHLGWMDIDYAIRKDKPPALTDTSTAADIALYERWERSNRFSMMFIKTRISIGIRGSVNQHEKVRDLLKAIDEQFVTSDKALASTLIMKFSSLRLTSVRSAREHIMQIRDIVAQLKKLEVEMSESFLVHYILNTLPHQYGPFKISYNTHKDKWSINELMTMCVQEEGRLAEVEKQCGKQIKIVRSDKGGEYYGRYTEDGQAPGPFAKLSSRAWDCCPIHHAWFTRPEWSSRKKKPNIIRTWCGVCLAAPIFLNPCGLKHLRRQSLRIVESRNAKFLENDLISGTDQTRNIVSKKDHSESQPSTSSDRLVIVYSTPQVQTGVEQPIIEVPQAADDVLVDQVVQELPRTFEQRVEPHTSQEYDGTTLRRSIRPKRSTIPDDYVVYLQESDYNIGAENDPEFFSQAMSCKESELWYNAMKEEMNSMKSNGVWDLVELPNGVKAIGCKWVFKTKKDSLGNIERYKARLVAKGFTQKEGIDYTETFSPVSKKDSLRVILALVAHFDLELQQMDVKTAFLNGDLEEEVYMKQPEGFPSSDGEHLVCKLKKSIYGLKQASRQWIWVRHLMSLALRSIETDFKLPIVKGDRFNLNQCPKNDLEREQMKNIPYASAVGSLMYAQVYTRPDIAFAMGMLGRYQSDPGLDHWRAAKKVMRYLQGTKDYMLMYRRT